MSIFGFNEASAIAAWGTFVFWQPSTSTYTPGTSWFQSKKKRKEEWEKMYGEDGRGSRWLQWLVLLLMPVLTTTILYPALTVFIFYFTQITPADTWQLITGVAVFMVHMMADKMWYMAFYQQRRFGAALIFVIIQVLTAGALYACLFTNPAGTLLFWIPLSLLILWSLVVIGRGILTIAVQRRRYRRMHPDYKGNDSGGGDTWYWRSADDDVYVRMRDSIDVPTTEDGRIIHHRSGKQ